jgi:hypothetical protein
LLGGYFDLDTIVTEWLSPGLLDSSSARFQNRRFSVSLKNK